MSQLAYQCENILDEVVMSNEEIKVKCFCEKVKDVTSKIHNLSGKVIKNYSYVIEVAKQEELMVGCPVVDFSSQVVSHNPCERPKVLNGEQRFLIQRTPCQPHLKSFPINETNKLNPPWYNSFPDLAYG